MEEEINKGLEYTKTSILFSRLQLYGNIRMRSFFGSPTEVL